MVEKAILFLCQQLFQNLLYLMNQTATGRFHGHSFTHKFFCFFRQEIILLASMFAAGVRKDSCRQESLPPSAGRFLERKKMSFQGQGEILALSPVHNVSGRFSYPNNYIKPI